jgi:hypothetical protein
MKNDAESDYKSLSAHSPVPDDTLKTDTLKTNI